MKNVGFAVILILFSSSLLFAQEETGEKIPLKEKLFFGGSFGMSFGNVTFIDLSPVVGYKISPRFSAGTGAIYQYTNFRKSDFSSHTFGGRLFGTAKLFDPVFAQVEYEYLSYEYLSFEGKRRTSFSSVLGGGGVSQPVSENVFLNFTALYNFTYSLSNSEVKPYDSPWVVRVSLTAGF